MGATRSGSFAAAGKGYALNDTRAEHERLRGEWRIELDAGRVGNGRDRARQLGRAFQDDFIRRCYTGECQAAGGEEAVNTGGPNHRESWSNF